jgi:hypothetical protein
MNINIYTQRFQAICPANGGTIDYVLSIEATRTIMVEDIQSAVGEFKTGYHEDFADRLSRKFGGTQKLVAHHHGTDIETVRSEGHPADAYAGPSDTANAANARNRYLAGGDS